MTLPFFLVDAFTREPFSGNAAGVVLEADGLSDEQMAAVAFEIGVSATVFALRPSSQSADLRLRFFTPHAEEAICGHGTIAALHVMGGLRLLPFGQRQTLQIAAGEVGVMGEQAGSNGPVYFMEQLPPTVYADELDSTAVAALLSLPPEAVTSSGLPVAKVSTGRAKILVPVRNLADVRRARPDLDGIAAYNRATDSTGMHVFTLETIDPAATVYGRHFAPLVGVAEDPVTGNSNAALAAYLVTRGVVDGGDEIEVRGEQGHEVGRPGLVRVRVRRTAARIDGISVGGAAVTVLEGRLTARAVEALT